jgi:two-component system KDP operon response regulator KdpE
VTKILVVDDEPQILRAMRINLTAHGYEVAVAPDGSSALRAAADSSPDLVILDLGLPDIDGYEVIEGLRGWTRVPILVLSGRATSTDKVRALDAGADDYVTKPFDIGELLARVRAVTRRRPAGDAIPKITIGRSEVDLSTHTIVNGDNKIRLTPTEWQLLEILLRNPGKLVSQRQLLHSVWGPAYDRETNYLRQYMAQLRRKLEENPSRPAHLITEPGMGYRYRPLTSEMAQALGCHNWSIAATYRRSSYRYVRCPRLTTTPATKSSPSLSRIRRRPAKSESLTVPDALTSMPATLPSRASITRSTSRWV